jgi:GNAT superfamily N-acetyltransferase
MPNTPGLSAPGDLQVREIPEGDSLDEFIELGWSINAADPAWIAPLRMSLRTALDRAKHPFHAHADVAYFIAHSGGRAVGRVAAIVNHLHNEFHQDRVGFFGLFEATDDPAVAAGLLDSAAGWLRTRGMDTMRGPVNFSTNEEVSSPGVLIEGFDTPPMAMMTHNPRYYGQLLESAGLVKAKDVTAYWLEGAQPPERLARNLERVLAREGATIRTLNLKRFRQDVDTIKKIYNSAWSANWGFVPMTDAEFDHLAKEFRPVVDASLCLIAEVRGEAVGFSLALPNINQALRHLPNGRLFPFGLFRFLWHKRKIRGIRMLTLGFTPPYQRSGLGAAFYTRAWLSGIALGYDHGEASWILEDNLDMVRPLERMGAREYKRYRIFERPI